MAGYTAADVKKLRDETDAPIMDCKSALEEADGDLEKAKNVLREKGKVAAAKRSGRSTGAGVVAFASKDNGKTVGGVVLESETDFVARTEDFKQFARDIAMQVAAANPEYLNPEAVPAEVVEREKAIYRKEAEGKPEAVAEKIVEGKLAKYYEQVCLVNQPFVKDPDVTITKLTTNLVAKLGENIVIRRFERMELGA